MAWMPENVKAEMDYRLEEARRFSSARNHRDPSARRQAWWRKLRNSHAA